MAAPPECDRDVPSFVAAFDARTGRTLWRHRSGPVEASPLVVGGAVLTGSWDGRLSPLDVASGRVRWTFATGAAIKAGAALAGSAAIWARTTTARSTPSTRGRVACAGRSRVGAPFYATATVAGARVFDATVDGIVHAFDARSGAVLWSRRIGRFAYSAAAVAGGRVYVGSYDHRLYALDAGTGEFSGRTR